jgi:hypothetical protein
MENTDAIILIGGFLYLLFFVWMPSSYDDRREK